MYQPPHFREDRLAVQHALIRAQSLGLLITAGPGGLQANHLPFLIDAGGAERGTLRAHLARANPQWHELAAVDECLVVFQGPQHYISPSLYPTKHEHGKGRADAELHNRACMGPTEGHRRCSLAQVDDLTLHKERSRPAPWLVSDAPEPFVAAQMKSIVGLEIPIARIEGKWKVSQNRPATDQAGVVAGLSGGSDDAEIMASLVAERIKNRP